MLVLPAVVLPLSSVADTSIAARTLAPALIAFLACL
jgi:hypothetical protein